MIKITVTFKTPDLSKRGMSRAYRDAVDKALLFHRRAHLPKHFLSFAPAEYGAVYKGDKAKRQEHFRKRMARADKQGRKALIEELQESKDRKNSRPLYQTGRLAASVTKGNAILTGPSLTRRLVLRSLPPYLTASKPGQMDKVAAITAITDDERTKMARILDDSIQQHFTRNTKTMRSR